MSSKKGLLQRLEEGVVIGDGGFVIALEHRGYVKAGPWTPEATVEHPEAVRQLHREFLRAGSDVMQAFTFYASDGKLSNRGNQSSALHTCSGINEAGCKLAREVANEGDALVAGGLSQTPTFITGAPKASVQKEFKVQVDAFMTAGVDFVIAEYFEHIKEMEWAIEVCVSTGLPVVASMAIGPEGDLHGVSTGECGLRMVKAGAHVVGINCQFDPFITLKGIRMMKEAVDKAGLKTHYIAQPLCYYTPEANKQGYIALPEFPYCLESRLCTRFDINRFAREAYEIGVRYIGGCCGFEPYHIRAISEELSAERGGILPKASEKHAPWGSALKMHTKPWVRARACEEHWRNLNPASGRPYSASFSKCDNWEVDPGSNDLKPK